MLGFCEGLFLFKGEERKKVTHLVRKLHTCKYNVLRVYRQGYLDSNDFLHAILTSLE